MARSGRERTSGRWTNRDPLEERAARCEAPGLRWAREAAGMTLEQLAEKAGYSVGVVADIEDGKIVHRMVVSRLAGVLGADPAVLRGEVR